MTNKKGDIIKPPLSRWFNYTCYMKSNRCVTIWDTECIFVEESDGIIIIPKDKDSFKNFRPHFKDENFIFRYCEFAGNNSIAVIERVEYEPYCTIKLIPKYIVKDSHDNSFTGFEMIGEIIDDFFSPSSYFYDRSKSGVDMHEDFIYHDEVAAEWTVAFEKKSIAITLSYGGILYEGIASDLMLHSKLRISFEKTTDVQYVYRIYLFIVRFLQIVRYDTNCGKLQINLYSERNGNLSYNGHLSDMGTVQNHHLKRYNDVGYRCYKPYIQRFLQFAADAQSLRFLEILTYAQLLKRVGLEDEDIERVICALFRCNYVLFLEKLLSI